MNYLISIIKKVDSGLKVRDIKKINAYHQFKTQVKTHLINISEDEF